MDVFGYLSSRAIKAPETDYEKGRQYAHKSIANIYKLLGKSYDQTRQSIYFCVYLRKMSDYYKTKEEDFCRGQTDAFDEAFEYFHSRKINNPKAH